MKRRIGVITVARSDYGLYRPILKRIATDSQLALMLYVSGAHFADTFGTTVTEIEADGFPIVARVPMISPADRPADIARTMGEGTANFARVFHDTPPDILLVLGDRFEMFAGALAAVPFGIPIAHIHGGELTEGAMDEYFRHALTKISHLHFATTDIYARRIIQMGEDPWRVVVSGAPALDTVLTVERLSRSELQENYDVDFSKPILLVTFHPVTMEAEHNVRYLSNLLQALGNFPEYTIVFTYPNADAGRDAIIQSIEAYRNTHAHARVVKNFGHQGHLSMMAHARAMIGNSSSGIIEAASFGLPVVNIGTRQQGRVRPKNVLDVGYATSDVEAGIREAISDGFRNALCGPVNPYGDGHASERIVERLRTVDLARLTPKLFYDC